MAAAAEVVPDCPHCQKPMPLCICDSITPIENKVSLLILQHPQEQDRALGTARLTALHFARCGAQDRPVLAEPVQGAGTPGARSLALGRALSRFRQGRGSRNRPRYRRHRPQGRGRGEPARHPERHRGHRAARRHLEPGQGAVVAQCLDAEMPARHPRPDAAVALRQAAQGAARRRAVHHRGGGDAAGRASRSGRISPRRCTPASSGCWRGIGRCRTTMPEIAPKPKKKDYRRRKRA